MMHDGIFFLTVMVKVIEVRNLSNMAPCQIDRLLGYLAKSVKYRVHFLGRGLSNDD